ncbi:DUF4442 domain-containing protein [Desertivirga xinjiangensis]|uniref:DUF4442 domain-containing protein n=1 Tax=Desertivirga xinjiangensis TaxID=539206 RepID=UPI00210C5E5F|nr:DUF4442 domain-containing protein [Pedobacter xinjiangensis]
MVVSERALKWAMRIYPPLLLQRIWVMEFHKGFMGVNVKIARSILNINYNRSIFGGTIFCAADPFYPILFHEILLRRGYKTRIWVKHTEVDFIKPGRTSLYFEIRLSKEDIEEVCTVLQSGEKFLKTYLTEVSDKNGQLCALVKNEIYIRHLIEA